PWWAAPSRASSEGEMRWLAEIDFWALQSRPALAVTALPSNVTGWIEPKSHPEVHRRPDSPAHRSSAHGFARSGFRTRTRNVFQAPGRSVSSTWKAPGHAGVLNRKESIVETDADQRHGCGRKPH